MCGDPQRQRAERPGDRASRQRITPPHEREL
jgi:hypothetical protein